MNFLISQVSCMRLDKLIKMWVSLVTNHPMLLLLYVGILRLKRNNYTINDLHNNVFKPWENGVGFGGSLVLSA